LTFRTDPESVELKASEKYVSFEDKDILEIGCGEGRFTAKYLDKARSVVAIDTDANSLQIADTRIPLHLRRKVRFLTKDAENLDLGSESFDVVIFSWSLCCIPDPYKALKEARRVLRSRGKLLNLMPDAVPTFETATIQKIGGKDAVYEGSIIGFRALIDSVREGFFLPFDEQRVIFHTYFDGMVDFIDWLPSKLGPLNKEEFKSLSEEALDEIKKYASAFLTQDGGGLLVKDALIVSNSEKR
jgi:SAM-dependent methyltransferase